MSSGNRMKALGTGFETDVVNYLRARGFPNAYRPATASQYDSGDINGIKRYNKPLPGEGNGTYRHAIIQCKRVAKFNLSGWLNDAVGQAKQEIVGCDALPIVVFKRPGVGVKTLGESYALLRLEDIAQLLKEAGYS